MAVEKLCYEEEKVPKLVENKSQIIKFGEGTYYCMFSEHPLRIPIMVDSLSCSIDYDVHKKRACCDGYHAVGDECMPSCRLKCIFGECVAPNTCDCYSAVSLSVKYRVKMVNVLLRTCAFVMQVSSEIHLVDPVVESVIAHADLDDVSMMSASVTWDIDRIRMMEMLAFHTVRKNVSMAFACCPMCASVR
uniref:Uncharacterized protein n=1 Tax=Anopheles maculatus TaxID=74869 RepID=A0A182SIZ1_9DIPT